MSAIHNFIINQRARAVSEGVKMIRAILKSNPFPNGFKSSQLFHLAVQQPPPSDFPVYHHPANPPVPKKNNDRFRKIKPAMAWAPSHPEHPIRSVRFLKEELLPVLVNSFEIKMVKQKKTPDEAEVEVKVKKGKQKGRDPTVEFVWKVVGPDERRPLPRSKPVKEVVGKEVGPDEIRPLPRSKPVKEVVGKEVGVGLDFGHLNKRRQNARDGKIRRDVETMKHTWAQD